VVVRPPPAPEPEPVPPPRPPPRPATLDELAALSHHFVVGKNVETPEPPSTHDDEAFTALAERWGPPLPLEGEDAASARFDILLQAVDDLDAWVAFEKHDQRALLGYAVAQARYAQEVVGGPTALTARQGTVFRRLTSWSAEFQPGFVWGLAASHAPRRGSTWLDDARGIWVEELRLPLPRPNVKAPRFSIGDLAVALRDRVPDEILHQIVLSLLDHPAVDQDHLTQVLADHLDRLSGHVKFKKLKKRIVRLRKDREDDAPEEEAQETLPTDWAWRHHTEGRRVVMLGGDARQASELRIRTLFGTASLTWETGWDNRRVESLAERIRSGNVDLLLIIQRFVNHTATNAVVPVCKETGVPFVVVSGGYGANQIRHAIEAKLQPAGEPSPTDG
jgi:hypothetical protein